MRAALRQQHRPERAGVLLGQVGQRRLGVAAADHLQAQLGEPQQPSDERADDVDALDPGERDPPGAADEQPAVDLQLAARHPVPRGAPDDGAQQAHDQGADGQQHDERGEGRALAQALRAERGEHQHQGPAAAQQRRQGVQALPAAVLVRPGGELRGGGGHRLAARASPRAVSRSRSRAASWVRSPGTEASVAAAAVWSVTVARP